jgi:hypothetical protein
MPVSVYTPVCIRVDSTALEGCDGCLDEALEKAAGRALANSRDRVLAAHGGYLGVRLCNPEFVWKGDGLPEVSAARRNELEQRWRDVLLDTARRSHLDMFAHDALPALDLLAVDLSERFDPARWNEGEATYQLPSYDEQGANVPVGQEDPDVVIAARKGVKLGWLWKGISSEDEFDELFSMGLASRNLDEPASGHLGALYLNGDDNEFWLNIFEYPGRRSIANSPPKFTRLSAEGEGIGEAPADFPPDADYKIRLFGDAGTADGKSEIYRKFYGDAIKSLLKNPSQERIDEEVAAMVAKVPEHHTRFVALMVNDQDASLIHTDVGFPTETFDVIPLAYWGEISAKPGTGTGGPGARTGVGDAGKDKKVDGGKDDQGQGKTAFATGDEEGGSVLFPTYAKDGDTLECGAFDGEPSLTELGADGERLLMLIEKLAAHLVIDTCEYAGAFCLNAAKIIGGRADDVATYSVSQEVGELKPARSGEGNLGQVNFKPIPSVSVQLLQHLAAAAPLIHELSSLIQDIYTKPENAAKIRGYRHGSSAGWELDFISELLDAMGRSVGYLFAMTCRVLLLQLLRASRQGIMDRQRNPGYADRFEQLVKAQVTPLDDLKRLLDNLKPFAPTSVGDEAGTLLLGTWQEARHEVISMFELQNPSVGVRQTGSGSLEWKNGSFHIRDSKDYLWSRQELETAIAIRTAVAEAIDPLVIQIDADPEVAARFRAAENIQDELAKLLDEMWTYNAEKIRETESSAYFAFTASKISEADTRFSGTARSGYNLTGIHKLANEALEDQFEGSDFYRLGLKYLFDAEMGKREILGFFEFTGVLLLSVLCAPLGVVVGGALSLYHEHEALEEQRLFKSLLNPEIVITRAAVEIDLFVGELGVALAFIPEAGTILKGAGRAGSALIKGELVAVTKAFAVQAAKGIAKEVIKNLEKGLLEAFIKEFIKAEIINELVGKLIVGPVVEQIQVDFERTLMAREALER